MKKGRKALAALLAAFMISGSALPDTGIVWAMQTDGVEQTAEIGQADGETGELVSGSVDLSKGLTVDAKVGDETVLTASALEENLAATANSLSASQIKAIKGDPLPSTFKATHYVTGAANPVPGKGSVPSTGTAIKLVAARDCSVTFVVRAGGKAFYCVHETEGDVANVVEETKALASGFYSVECSFKGGSTYYAYVDGSRGRFYSILYSYDPNQEPVDPDPDVPDDPNPPANPDDPDDQVDGLDAFPGAEGGGRFASGGRGGDVYVVTNLEDYNQFDPKAEPIPGSLRYGIKTAPKEGRTIVFNVGGTINLKTKLPIGGQNLTIAGQTAPGDGITIAGFDTDISGSQNLIIRFVRFRVGTDNLLLGGDSMDALWGRDNDTFIIDHCTFSWNTDETLSTYRGRNGTVQWCIISESLTVSGHSKGRHGYGGIFGGDNCVFQYNLIANHTSRNPRIGGGVFGDPKKETEGGKPNPAYLSMATLQLSNNVLYNYGYNNCYGGGCTYTNYINNYQKIGRGTSDSIRNQQINPGEKTWPGGFYINGNVKDVNGTVTAYGTNGIKNSGDTSGTTATIIAKTPYAPVKSDKITFNGFKQITLVSAEECYPKVLNSAGATFPARDAIDARVVAQVETNMGAFINVPEEVGGYCAQESQREDSFDADGDGIADAWETAHGLDPKDATDSLTIITDENDPNCGYSWLEVYCNDLVKDVVASGYKAPNPTVTIDLADNTLADEGTEVKVTATAKANNGGNIAKVEFYNGDKLVGTADTAPYTYTYSDLPDGTYHITVRAYDNEGNATQSSPSRLHVNSTAGTGSWQSVDIGKPEVKGTASLIGDVMTVKSAGKLGASEGKTTRYNDATTDDFHFVCKEFTGDNELVVRLDEFTAVDNHSFNGIMFRESLDTKSAAIGLGLSLVKQNGEKGTTWSAYMVRRATNGGKMTEIRETIDSPSAAQKAGIPLIADLNFKSDGKFNGIWLKLTRTGNSFTGSVSEDGKTWTEVGTLSVTLPEKAFAGLAVDANKVANDLVNYSTAKFSYIDADVELADVTYELENLESKGPNTVVIGEDLKTCLTAKSGYELPDSIEVTMGGQQAEFTYEKETGTVTVAKVSGDVVIKAVGVKQIVYANISYELENLTTNGPDSVEMGKDLSAKLIAEIGYDLPENIEVTMGGQDTEFTYEKETGTVTVAAVSGDVVIKAAGVKQQGMPQEPVRIAGTSRYSTASECAELMRKGGTFSAVVIACADNFPDALAGSTLAASVQAPILLAGKSEAETQKTLDYIKEHVDKEGMIYLLGGTSAVPESVVSTLKEYGFKESNIKRLGGTNRYETNMMIVNEMDFAKGTDVVIVSGSGYADSLSISGIAGARKMPIFLAGNSLTEEATAKIKEIAPEHIYVIGGTAAVNEEVYKQAESLCVPENVKRIAGVSRYATSLAVAEFFEMEKADTAVFAYGGNFPDGLTGGAFAASLNAPIILVSNDNYTDQEKFLNNSNIMTTYVMGGTSVISDETISHLKKQ